MIRGKCGKDTADVYEVLQNNSGLFSPGHVDLALAKTAAALAGAKQHNILMTGSGTNSGQFSRQHQNQYSGRQSWGRPKDVFQNFQRHVPGQPGGRGMSREDASN